MSESDAQTPTPDSPAAPETTIVNGSDPNAEPNPEHIGDGDGTDGFHAHLSDGMV